MNEVKTGDELIQIGDTFSLSIEKITLISNYNIVEKIYNAPTFSGKGSAKYLEQFNGIFNVISTDLELAKA